MHPSWAATGPVLPRSALLAAWGTAALNAGASSDQAARAVRGDDEPHEVLVLPGAGLQPSPPGAPSTSPGAALSLAQLLDALRHGRAGGLRLVLPVPGDVLGLPGPAALNAEALESGECVTTLAGPRLAVLAQVRRFGSPGDQGHQVRWRVHPAGSASATDFGSLGEAERHLREALIHGTDLLEDLDLNRAGPGTADPAASDAARPHVDVAERLADLRHGPGPTGQLPPGTSARAVRVLDLAWRVGAIAELAALDDGGSVTGYQAQTRGQALRDLRSVARRAVVAGINDATDRLR